MTVPTSSSARRKARAVRSPVAQDKRTRMTESPLRNLGSVSPPEFFKPKKKRGNRNKYILLMKRSLLTGRPFFPPAIRGVSVHISLTFSRTILQCRSKALTRASNLRLLRHDIRTCVCDRTAVWRMESGPDVNSYSSICAISNSLQTMLASTLKTACQMLVFSTASGWTYISSLRGFARRSLISSAL